MTPTQPTLPPLPDYSQPQTVAASRLVTVIAQANAAGFRAIGLTVLPAAYRVTFERNHFATKTQPLLVHENRTKRAKWVAGPCWDTQASGNRGGRYQLAREKTMTADS